MKIFRDLTDNVEEMEDFNKKVHDDDAKLQKYFETCSHKEFISCIIDIGVLLDSVATYFDFLNPKMALAIGGDEDKRSRKINKYLNDLNHKINEEYGFDKNTFIVEEGVLYDNHVYLFINKSQFIKMKQLDEL